MSFGRCPVRAVFPDALEVLRKRAGLFGYVFSGYLWGEANSGERFMAENIMPLTEAVEGYELFDKMKVQKVIFRADA
jgi:hypothetical protein